MLNFLWYSLYIVRVMAEMKYTTLLDDSPVEVEGIFPCSVKILRDGDGVE